MELDAPPACAGPATRDDVARTSADLPTTPTHDRFFRVLRELGRLRVISQCGASTFEALCELGPFGFGHGHMNAITDAYHWHVSLERFRHVRTRDEVHARSGRRVLYFELREDAGAEPFLRIYLHREKGEEFAPEREALFAGLHRAWGAGVTLDAPERA